ncbi:MAG: GNAT family N-acetyltransferase [Imperialibacter sp.]|uniref:GNAT family N-acetyltransferase n=1 Tax=Imperialibacter sp. TaxID=2038411 RepID=UPI003A846697
MSKSDFILRPLKLIDISAAMTLSTAEGWNQTENDWALLIKGSEGACVLAEHDSKVIGTTTAINYSHQLAWIGMVLVDKAYRGQGVSKALLDHVFKNTSEISIKLDATPAGQQVYQQFGFKDEYLIDRMVHVLLTNSASFDNSGIETEPVKPENIKEIVAFDAAVFGTKREHLITSLVKEYPDKAWIVRHKNRVTGFVLGRGGSKYHHVGPVSASTMEVAQALLAKSLEGLVQKPVVVDVLQDKQALIASLKSMGFTKQRHFVRMYKGENHFPGIAEHSYCICGPEFG